MSAPRGPRIRTKLKEPKKCVACSLTLPNYANWKLHTDHEHGEDSSIRTGLPFRCGTCAIRFKTVQGLRNHETKSHKPVQEVTAFQCDICHQYFRDQSEWKYHFERAHRRIKEIDTDERKKHVCAICGMRYLHLAGLRYHDAHEHSGSHLKWPCGRCDARFAHKPLLVDHTRIHHPSIFDGAETLMLDSNQSSPPSPHGSSAEDDQGNQYLQSDVVSHKTTESVRSFKKGYSVAKFHPDRRVFGSQSSQREPVSDAMIILSLGLAERRAIARSVKEARLTREAAILLERQSLADQSSMAALADYSVRCSPRDSQGISRNPNGTGNCLPFPSFMGNMTVCLWKKAHFPITVLSYSLGSKAGALSFVFEYPRPLVEEIVSRAIPVSDSFYAVRFGPFVVLFSPTIPAEFIDPRMVLGLDYMSAPSSYLEARHFLSRDVVVGTQYNDQGRKQYSTRFLW